MCVTLTESLSKKCSCEFAHLCKRRRTFEIVQKKLEIELSLQGGSDKPVSPLAFTFAKVKKPIDAEKGNHI
jgi:hypothetical protein